MNIREELVELWGEDLLFADGYDSAITGVCVGFDSERVAYSIPKMINICVQEVGMEHSEALEWLEFNTFGAYVGKNTPIYFDDEILTLLKKEA